MSSLIFLILVSTVNILIQSLILFSEQFKKSISIEYKICLSLIFLLFSPTMIITIFMNGKLFQN
ncbi:hypothetical protein P3G55_18410 [Leptospira sp. 96542]|nr:hypothetical protein [Leptospira sp. 96542]